MASKDTAQVAKSGPTIEQIRAAVDVLCNEGASLVKLFGSAATGNAGADSDIDLVAVFDDIDYDERYPQRWRLEAKCTQAAGVQCDIHVTDWPEWKHRVEHVTSSFEAHIAPIAITFFERPPRGVDWGKEIGMPKSNLDAGVQRLRRLHGNLCDMLRYAYPSFAENKPNEEQDSDSPNYDVIERTVRLSGLCASASIVLENSLKALSTLYGLPPVRSHNINRLLQQFTAIPPSISATLEVFASNTIRPSRDNFDDISCWRIGSVCADELPQANYDVVARLAPPLTNAAVVVASASTKEYMLAGLAPADAPLRVTQDKIEEVREVLDSGDVVAGIVELRNFGR